MRDAETRVLRHAVVVLLTLAACRWAWSTLRSPAAIPGTDVLPTLLAGSESRLADATERERPLGPGERLDPNAASATELDRLPGVGAGTAAAIVRDRAAHGPFRTPDDLTRVPGVGAGTLKGMLPHLKVTGGARSGGSAGASGGHRREAPRGAAGARIDVNRADEAALQTLPGVGPALARRIVEARKQRPFATVEELARVRGIGPATVARLRARIRVHR